MSDILPGQVECCDDDTPCCEETIQVPGPAGENGENGENGTDGVNAYTALTAGFTMPAELANVTAAVGSSVWMTVGQVLFIENAGHMEVVSKPTSTSVSLKNLEDSSTGEYDTNAAPATAIANASTISPAGMEGPSGSQTGAAGGDLIGTYPNPRVGITTTKGDLIVNNAGAATPRNTRLGVGTDGMRLRANAATGTGLDWAVVDLSNASFTEVENELSTTNGGTGAAGTLSGLIIGDATDPTLAMHSLVYKEGFSNFTLTNSNAALTLGVTDEHYMFSGTLTGPVQITLNTTGAETGAWFWIQFNAVVVTSVNTLDIRDSGTGSLLLFNTNNTVRGMIKAIWRGTFWQLFNVNSITLS